MDMQTLRKEIDLLDRELVQIFCRRMEVAARIADYKKEHNLPISHPGREQEVLQKVSELAGSEMSDYAQSLYAEIFKLSKHYQSERNNSV